MKNYLLLALLACSYLLAHPAKSQIRPLRPLVVTLDSGTIVQRPLIGIVPSAYADIRLGQDSDARLLLVRADRLRKMGQVHRADSLALAICGRENRLSRLDVAALNGQLTKQEALTAKVLKLPVQKPFLLDPHTYKGMLLGALALAGWLLTK